MLITVVLCTYNRCGRLSKALDSVAASVLPNSVDWEVLVVDNNSNDQTQEVVRHFCCQYPGRFRYLFEPRAGKSHALNTAIRESHGDVLAFMDDDVTVEPTWLQNLTACLHDGTWIGCGGRIYPEKSLVAPDWLPLEGPYGMKTILALFDLNREAGDLDRAPFGANMAFRKSAFEKYGGFRTDLGPRPGSEIRSEDTEFGSRLLRAGERLRYEPSAVVYHDISEGRLTRKYFLTWWFDKGRTNIREFGILPRTRFYVLGIPLYLFRNLLVWSVRSIVSIEPHARFSCWCKVFTKLGEISECYSRSRSSQRGHPAAERQETVASKDSASEFDVLGPFSK